MGVARVSCDQGESVVFEEIMSGGVGETGEEVWVRSARAT